MERFEDYFDQYDVVKMEREERGILQIRLHTEDGPLSWGHIGGAHEQLSDAFGRIARDKKNRVVVLTGTGDSFSGPPGSAETFPWSPTVDVYDTILTNSLELTLNLLAIDAPVISCVNGPALRHAEIPLLGDIVLACPQASFQDSAHFINRTTPGDGINIFMPLLMGFTRGRYFLLTGQEITASEALNLGLVNEIHERERLLERAMELAGQLAQQSDLVLRYTRRAMIQPLREMVFRHLGYGLALEGLAVIDETQRRGQQHRPATRGSNDPAPSDGSKAGT